MNLKLFFVFSLFVGALPNLSFANLGESVVKIVAHDPVSGLSTAASGLIFRFEKRLYVVTAEHAVLNTSVPGTHSLLHFHQRVVFVPDGTPPEGGWPASKIFSSIRALQLGPIPTTDGSIWMDFEGQARQAGVGTPIDYAIYHDAVSTGMSAKFIASDWGRGLTLLEAIPSPAVASLPAPEWTDLKNRMGGSPHTTLALGGYSATSRRVRVNTGTRDSAPFTAPLLAQVDSMISVADSYAEFGMSGGAAWDRDDHYVGLISHLGADEGKGRRVLLVPGEFVRDWLTHFLEAKDLEFQLYKDVSQTSADGKWEALYSKGVVYTLNCFELPCAVTFDLNARENPTSSYLDHSNHVLNTAKKRLEFFQTRKHGDDPYVGTATVRGFRPIASLSDFPSDSTQITGFTHSAEFFHLIRDPRYVPIVEFGWSFVPTTEEKIQKVQRSLARLNEVFRDEVTSRINDRTGTPAQNHQREMDGMAVSVLLTAVQNAESSVREIKGTDGGLIHKYDAALIPADFDVLFTDPEAIAAWEALDRLVPGRRVEYEKMIRAVRFELGDVVVDTAEDYKR